MHPDVTPQVNIFLFNCSKCSRHSTIHIKIVINLFHQQHHHHHGHIFLYTLDCTYLIETVTSHTDMKLNYTQITYFTIIIITILHSFLFLYKQSFICYYKLTVSTKWLFLTGPLAARYQTVGYPHFWKNSAQPQQNPEWRPRSCVPRQRGSWIPQP